MYQRAPSNASSDSLLDEKTNSSRPFPGTLRRWTSNWLGRFDGSYDAEAIQRYQGRSSFWPFFGKLCLIVFALWGVLSLGFQSKKFYNDHVPVNCDCGASIAEARSMGCKYDSMAAAWLPDQCRDDELIEEFNHAGPGPNGEWYYWRDANAEYHLTLEDMANLADTGEMFFTTWDWHVAHCFFFFKKQIRGGFTSASLGTSDPYHHIEHCQEIVHSDRAKLVESGVGLNSSSFT